MDYSLSRFLGWLLPEPELANLAITPKDLGTAVYKIFALTQAVGKLHGLDRIVITRDFR